jgi:MFS family permease
MKLTHKLILFLNWLGTGIMMPVLSLALLSRGCTLQTLGVAFGIYSVIVIAGELPSGIFADIYGRKTAFLISCAANVISFVILLFSAGFWATAAAMLFQGLGRAFSSGSIEALMIEQSMEKYGENCLGRVTSSISVAQCSGIAVGALIGGVLPDYNDYTLHIAVRAALIIAVGLLALLLLRESGRDGTKRITLKEHLTESKNLLMNRRALKAILLCIGMASVMLFSLETYWQPALRAIAKGNPQLLSGVICTAGFAATALGSFVMGRIKPAPRRSRWAAYLCLIAGVAVSLLLLSFQKSAAGFAAMYVLFYLFLGAVNVPEQTIVNAEVPNEMRAAMLSAASFSSQAGGVMSSLLCSMLIGAAGIPGIWRIAVSLGSGAAVLGAVMMRGARTEPAPDTAI